MSCCRRFAIGLRLVYCLETYLLRKGPPHEASGKELPDARKSCSLSPKIPFALAKAMFWGVASPCVADQTIYPTPPPDVSFVG